MNLDSMIIPAVMCGIIIYALAAKVDVFEAFLDGAKEGFATAVSVLPALVALMTGVGIFKASGALDYLTLAVSPVSELFTVPAEVVPLAILRSISGSGAMAIYKGMLDTFGPDSYIGRIASVMEGSSETTFYTIAVYYGATKITKTRHTLPASLTADLIVVIMSVIMVRAVFGAG